MVLSFMNYCKYNICKHNFRKDRERETNDYLDLESTNRHDE